MWFKEYAFNIIIQPVHLLIYTVLVGSATALAKESMVYAIVAIYFIVPAENLIRKFFGFDKSGTLSAAGSFAGGAIFSSVIGKLNRPKAPENDKEEKPKNLRKASANGVPADEELLGKGGAADMGLGRGGRRRTRPEEETDGESRDGSRDRAETGTGIGRRQNKYTCNRKIKTRSNPRRFWWKTKTCSTRIGR